MRLASSSEKRPGPPGTGSLSGTLGPRRNDRRLGFRDKLVQVSGTDPAKAGAKLARHFDREQCLVLIGRSIRRVHSLG